MIKILKVLMSVSLIVVLVFSSVPAHAESCYVALREMLNSIDQEEWYLGKGKSTLASEVGKKMYAVYMEKTRAFLLIGENEYGKGEITSWGKIDRSRGYYMIYSLCRIWKLLQEHVDEGYSISIGFTDMEQVEGDMLFENAEAAAAFVQVTEETLGSATSD